MFTISTSGAASVKATYMGYPNITTGANIKITIQKRFLFFWFDVDGGEWDDDLTGWNNSTTHSLDLTSTGSYRAVFEYTVYGSGGDPDEIEETIYRDYD